MREVWLAMGDVLRADEVLNGILGLDEFGFPKIYGSATDRPAPTEPPFVYYQVIPGREPAGIYQDIEALGGADVQVTSWGRTSDEVWRINQFVYDAIRAGDWETRLLPLHFMRVKRSQSPGELPDRDTNWRQVPDLWRVDTSR